jgi:hypothetical protein
VELLPMSKTNPLAAAMLMSQRLGAEAPDCALATNLALAAGGAEAAQGRSWKQRLAHRRRLLQQQARERCASPDVPCLPAAPDCGAGGVPECAGAEGGGGRSGGARLLHGSRGRTAEQREVSLAARDMGMLAAGRRRAPQFDAAEMERADADAAARVAAERAAMHYPDPRQRQPVPPRVGAAAASADGSAAPHLRRGPEPWRLHLLRGYSRHPATAERLQGGFEEQEQRQQQQQQQQQQQEQQQQQQGRLRRAPPQQYSANPTSPRKCGPAYKRAQLEGAGVVELMRAQGCAAGAAQEAPPPPPPAEGGVASPRARAWKGRGLRQPHTAARLARGLAAATVPVDMRDRAERSPPRLYGATPAELRGRGGAAYNRGKYGSDGARALLEHGANPKRGARSSPPSIRTADFQPRPGVGERYDAALRAVRRAGAADGLVALRQRCGAELLRQPDIVSQADTRGGLEAALRHHVRRAAVAVVQAGRWRSRAAGQLREQPAAKEPEWWKGEVVLEEEAPPHFAWVRDEPVAAAAAEVPNAVLSSVAFEARDVQALLVSLGLVANGSQEDGDGAAGAAGAGAAGSGAGAAGAAGAEALALMSSLDHARRGSVPAPSVVGLLLESALACARSMGGVDDWVAARSLAGAQAGVAERAGVAVPNSGAAAQRGGGGAAGSGRRVLGPADAGARHAFVEGTPLADEASGGRHKQRDARASGVPRKRSAASTAVQRGIADPLPLPIQLRHGTTHPQTTRRLVMQGLAREQRPVAVSAATSEQQRHAGTNRKDAVGKHLYDTHREDKAALFAGEKLPAWEQARAQHAHGLLPCAQSVGAARAQRELRTHQGVRADAEAGGRQHRVEGVAGDAQLSSRGFAARQRQNRVFH